MVDEQTSRNTTISAGQTKEERFSGVSAQGCRINAVISFDLAKSFIKPDQKPAIERVFLYGLTRQGSGTSLVPKSDEFLLIVGHSDQLGQPCPNQELSIRRARAVWAVFIEDAQIWEQLYQTPVARWGDEELQTMCNAVEEEDSFCDWNRIDELRNNRDERIELIESYFRFLRPDWVPGQSPAIKPNTVTAPSPPILGCGETHPLEDLENRTAEINRRVEFYYFRRPDLRIQNENDCPSEETYRSWRRLTICDQRRITVRIELQDEYGDPYVGPFDLTLPTGVILHDERTNDQGIWTRDDMPEGLYTVTIAGNSIAQIMQ